MNIYDKIEALLKILENEHKQQPGRFTDKYYNVGAELLQLDDMIADVRQWLERVKQTNAVMTKQQRGL